MKVSKEFKRTANALHRKLEAKRVQRAYLNWLASKLARLNEEDYVVQRSR